MPSHSFAFDKKQYDKYFQIGYNAYLAKLSRDLADDLVVTDRASFLSGWDAAKNKKFKA